MFDLHLVECADAEPEDPEAWLYSTHVIWL